MKNRRELGSGHVYILVLHSKMHGTNSQIYSLHKLELGHTEVPDTLKILHLPERLAL